MNSGTKRINHVARCPACGTPHHYIEVKFPFENDAGGWEVECRGGCGKPFTISLRNPIESSARDFRILDCFDDDFGGYQGIALPAKEIVQHSLDMNENRLRFNFDSDPIYRCAQSGVDLEKSALAELEKHVSEISNAFYGARNYILASSRVPDMEHVVVSVSMPCQCGSTHKAIFYFSLHLNDTPMPEAREMWLADVDGSSLDHELTGIFSKTFLMGALEKLIARWRLKYDQIVIASPFIAHQFMSKKDKLGVWQWLLGILDPRRTFFITRSASYKDYKTALLDSGLDHDFLVRFGLENQIVGAGAKKQDFHAKVYIGLGDKSEILSGSANLVPGKSMENASFALLERERVEDRYFVPLGVSLPQAPSRAGFHLAIEQEGTVWRADIKEGASPI
ncbi:hypothetical protein [Brucella pituitosa]|uniref:Uncharacterized protein n=1 Tax=Brucella pituitosa TaxID=571256 RepID=A0ABS3JZ39_9HYPH|nr:hypothetical protein [Brucella pituitosa]MBO1039944.1 hypothetical protein [Brucella pituitosa]